MAFTDVIARLAVSLNLDTAAFQTGSRKAQAEATGLQGHMTKVAKAVGTALAGMVSWEVVQQLRDMTKAAVDSAGGLGEQAAQLGVSTKALQEYRFAATQVGLESAEMDQGLAQLTRRLGDAAQGVKEPAAALERLGLSVKDIAGLDAGDVIPKIAEGLQRIPDPGQRAAIAVDLFGKAGQKLMPLLEGGAAGVEAFRVEAERLGVVLSSEEIAKADEVADKIAALNYQIEAQQNKKLLENADALLKYEEGVGTLKLTLIDAASTLQSWADDVDAYFARNAKAARENGTTIQAGFRQVWQGLHDFSDTVNGAMQSAHAALVRGLGYVAAFYQGVKSWISDKLAAVWNGAKAQIQSVADKFKWLWDVTVGHSYIPDMVDAIGAHMARLDALMVQPAQAAAGKVSEAMRAMAQETGALLDRLFPEVRKLLDYRKDLGTLDRAGLDPALDAAARTRLAREVTGTGGDIPLVMEDPGPLIDATVNLGDAFKSLQDRAGITTVAVAKSFKDMADQTIRSLSSLASAIKGGGFLGILEAVIGLGLQLGSVGVFGKTIANRINLPHRAMGGPVSANRPYLVGERGPELVVPQHSGRVIPNHKLGGGLGGTLDIRPSPLFEVYLDGKLVQAAPVIAEAGARGGVSRMAYQQRRRVG